MKRDLPLHVELAAVLLTLVKAQIDLFRKLLGLSPKHDEFGALKPLP